MSTELDSGTQDQDKVDHFTARMRPAVASAAALARRLEGRVQNAPKREETSDVKQAMTIADSGTQELLLKGLLEAFPDVCLAAEEDTDTVECFPKDASAQVIIDPIDGTLRSYLEASGPYAVIVGLAIREVYRAALVSLPREGLAFDGTTGQGAYVAVAGRSRRRVAAEPDGRRILVSHGMPEEVSEALRQRDYEVISACGGAVSVAPLIKGVCAGVRKASGPLGISIRGRAGVVISREGGALVETSGGKPFPTDMNSPAETLLIASGPKQLEHLGEALELA